MLLIKNAYIKTISGPDIDGGAILIGNDGKIAEIGKDIKASADCEVIDAEGRLVTPGLVEAHCHVGMHLAATRWEGNEVNEKSNPITPEMRAIDGLNPMDEYFDDARKGGVTTIITGPGSANVVGGTFAAVKTAGNVIDNMVVKFPVAMKCAFGENPKGAYGNSGSKSPVTRMATAALLRELLFKTRNYLASKEAGKEPSFDMKLEAMIPVIKGEIPLKAHAHRADDILTSIRIAKEFGVRLTLDHCTEGALIADELAKYDYPAFVGPSFCSKSKLELKNKTFETAAVLNAAGVKVSIVTDAPVTSIQRLAMFAGMAVTEGLPYDDAWRAITVNPAESTDISDRVGSLEVGKDGDVVIWQDDPLKVLGVNAYKTIINGKVVYSE